MTHNTQSANSLGAVLDEIATESREACMDRERNAFDRMAGAPCEKMVLFGAGSLGRYTLAALRRDGIEPVALADNNQKLWNTLVDGLTVLSPEVAVERFGGSAAFVAAVYNSSSVRKQLRELGCRSVIPFALLAWKYPDLFIPGSHLDLPHRIPEQEKEIRAGYGLLCDETSKREFCDQLRWRYWLDYDCMSPPEPACDTYFPNDVIASSDNEVFVDCGAFDGDSIRSFLQHRQAKFRRIIGLEPDPLNRNRLYKFIDGLPGVIRPKVNILPYAVGNANTSVKFAVTSTVGSKISSQSDAGDEVECRRLDDLEWQDIPTFIKMDIEGAEPEALQGGAELLRRHLPALAVCVYHRSEHLWQIPRLIHSISPDYNIFLRRYAEECWELVCYAVPSTRLAKPVSY